MDIDALIKRAWEAMPWLINLLIIGVPLLCFLPPLKELLPFWANYWPVYVLGPIYIITCISVLRIIYIAFRWDSLATGLKTVGVLFVVLLLVFLLRQMPDQPSYHEAATGNCRYEDCE